MKTIKYRTNYGVYHGLQVTTGKKFIHLILIQYPIKIIKVPTSEARYICDDIAPTSKVKRTLKRMAKTSYGTMRSAPKNIKQVLV